MPGGSGGTPAGSRRLVEQPRLPAAVTQPASRARSRSDSSVAIEKNEVARECGIIRTRSPMTRSRSPELRRFGAQVDDDRGVGADRQLHPAHGRGRGELLPAEHRPDPPGAQHEAELLGEAVDAVVVGGVARDEVADVLDGPPQLVEQLLEDLDEAAVGRLRLVERVARRWRPCRGRGPCRTSGSTRCGGRPRRRDARRWWRATPANGFAALNSRASVASSHRWVGTDGTPNPSPLRKARTTRARIWAPGCSRSRTRRSRWSHAGWSGIGDPGERAGAEEGRRAGPAGAWVRRPEVGRVQTCSIRRTRSSGSAVRTTACAPAQVTAYELRASRAGESWTTSRSSTYWSSWKRRTGHR